MKRQTDQVPTEQAKAVRRFAYRTAYCTAKITESTESQGARRWFIPLIVLLLLTLGCSAADLVQRERMTPTPEPAPELAATFTPTPVVEQTQLIVTPPSEDKPGVIIVPPDTDEESVLPVVPTESPTPTATPSATSEPGQATPTAIAVVPTEQPESPLPSPGTPTDTPGAPTGTPMPTATSTASATPVPTATPTPFVLVEGGLVGLRTGPGLQYPLLAQLGPEIPVAVIGRSEDGSWLEICCVSGQSVWVVATHVRVNHDVSQVSVSSVEPPPAPTPTAPPTETPTVTPTATPTPYPFERAIGPQFFPTNNEYITIWVKFFIGTPPEEVPAEGYTLVVKFEGFERANALGTASSSDRFQLSAPPGSGNRVEYNYKYEYRPPDPQSLGTDASRLQLLGTGEWTVFVSDGTGTQLSDTVTFTTAPSNPNREIYIGWVRVR